MCYCHSLKTFATMSHTSAPAIMKPTVGQKRLTYVIAIYCDKFHDIFTRSKK